jgi:N4-gp56 family major capsid protein
MANTTTTTGQILKEYWRDLFLNELRANLVFEGLAMKSAHGKGAGIRAHWIGLTDLTAGAALTQATDPTAYTFSATDQTADLVQYGALVEVSDVLKDTMMGGTMDALIERIGRNAADTVDTVIRNSVFSAGGLVQYGGTAVARNSIATDGSFDMDVAELREAVSTLEQANAPRFSNGYYVGVIHPTVKYDLQGDSAWLDIVKYTETGVERAFRGEVGEIYGVKFVQTTKALELVASGSASTDVFQTYVVGSEYFGVSELMGTEVLVKDPAPTSVLELKSSIGWKTTFAAKELQPSAMVRLETGASLAD